MNHLQSLHIKIITLTIFAIISNQGLSQNSSIVGYVSDENGKPIENANILLFSDTLQLQDEAFLGPKLFDKYFLVSGAVTDKKGNYFLSPIPSRKFYLIVVKYGYQISELREINLTKNKRFQFDFNIQKVYDSSELKNIPYSLYVKIDN